LYLSFENLVTVGKKTGIRGRVRPRRGCGAEPRKSNYLQTILMILLYFLNTGSYILLIAFWMD